MVFFMHPYKNRTISIVGDYCVCLLVLAVNLSFLLFDEILAKEKYVEEELMKQL